MSSDADGRKEGKSVDVVIHNLMTLKVMPLCEAFNRRFNIASKCTIINTGEREPERIYRKSGRKINKKKIVEKRNIYWVCLGRFFGCRCVCLCVLIREENIHWLHFALCPESLEGPESYALLCRCFYYSSKAAFSCKWLMRWELFSHRIELPSRGLRQSSPRR